MHRTRKEHRLVRVKTSITMDREFLKWVERKIKEKIFASRSHAIEYAIKKLMEEEKAKQGSF